MITPSPLDAADALIQGGRQRLRVLVAAAEPYLDREPLHLRREWQVLHKELAQGTLPTALVRLLPPSRETLVSTLERTAAAQVPVDVLHFAGHGEPDHLLFETALGETFRYGGDALAADLRGRGVRLVFLNACHSAPESSLSIAGHLVASGAIDAAIGHAVPVIDEAALLFSSLLYRGLCRGDCLRDAFGAAQEALGARRLKETARQIRLFGDGNLRFADRSTSTPRAAFSFDGRLSSGNMPEPPLFFGRSDELLTISRFFQATDKRVLALSGLGGLGKTTLALESAARHAWRFQGGLAVASACPQAEGDPTADSLIHAAMAVLLPPSSLAEMDVQRLFDHLKQHPGLLIFDQVETLSVFELQRLVRILEQLPSNGSKSILTLRTAPQSLRGWPWLQAMTLTTGLSPWAGCAYMLHTAQGKVPEWAGCRAPLDEGSQSLEMRLTRSLGGHPMLLELAVDIAATQGLPALLPALKTDVNELSPLDGTVSRGPATKAFVERMDTLIEAVAPLLDADGCWLLSFFPLSPDGTFTREELQAAAKSTERPAGRLSLLAARVTAGLASCFKTGLVEHETRADLYRVHPIVRWYVSGWKHRHGTEAIMELIEHCLAFVAARLHDHVALERRLSFLLGIFDQAWKPPIPVALQEPIVSALNQMSLFLMDRAAGLPQLSTWMDRLAQRRGETLPERAERLYRQSEILFSQGKLVESRQCIRESVEGYRKLNLTKGLAIALEQSAHIEMHQGNLDEARRAVDECLKLLRIDNHPETEVAALFDLASIEMRAGRLPEARAFLVQALDKQKVTDPLRGKGRIAAMTMMLGIATSTLGNPDEGRELVKQGNAIFRELGLPIGDFPGLLLAVQEASAQGDFVRARALLAQASALRMTDGRPEGRYAVLLARAAVERQVGQFAECEKTLDEALALFVKKDHPNGTEDHPNELAAIFNQRAELYMAQGVFPQARQWLEKSMGIQQRVGDDLNRARSLFLLSMLEYQKGDHIKALAYAEEALALDTALGNHLGRPNSLCQLGLIESQLGQDTKAVEHLSEALRLMETLNRRHDRATPLIMLARVETRRGRLAEARKHLQEAITLLEGTGNPLINVARDALMKVDGIKLPGGSPTRVAPEWLAELKSRAETLIRIAQPEKALGLIREAISNHGQKDGPGPLAEVHILEGESLAVAGQLREASEALDKAQSLSEAAGLLDLTHKIRELRQRIQRLGGWLRQSLG